MKWLALFFAIIAGVCDAAALQMTPCYLSGTTTACFLPLAVTSGGTGISSTATFPSSGTVVTEAATETLTNKTLSTASNHITGVTSGATASTGDIGETPAKVTGSVTATTTFAQWATITLQPGSWNLTGLASANGGAAVGTFIQLCIATTGGNSTAGTTAGYDIVYGAVNTAQGTGGAFIPSKQVFISTPTSYFLNGRSDHTTASDVTFSLTATRFN